MVPQQIMTEVAVPPRCHDVRNSSLMRLCIRGYIDIKSNSRGCMPFTTTQLPELAISLASATDTPPPQLPSTAASVRVSTVRRPCRWCHKFPDSLYSPRGQTIWPQDTRFELAETLEKVSASCTYAFARLLHLSATGYRRGGVSEFVCRVNHDSQYLSVP
jgi:hypothetical protein